VLTPIPLLLSWFPFFLQADSGSQSLPPPTYDLPFRLFDPTECHLFHHPPCSPPSLFFELFFFTFPPFFLYTFSAGSFASGTCNIVGFYGIVHTPSLFLRHSTLFFHRDMYSPFRLSLPTSVFSSGSLPSPQPIKPYLKN